MRFPGTPSARAFVRQTLHAPIDPSKSSFACDNPTLNAVYDFCRYSIAATGFAGVSYPDGCQLADGSLVVVYDRNRRTDREILAVRFREDDILSGKRPHPTLVQGRSPATRKGMP